MHGCDPVEKHINFIPLFRINVSLNDVRESQLAYSNSI